MFKQNFIRLCNQKGESPSYVCRQVGITPATYSLWTDRSVPRKATLTRIADYFGVTVDDLISLKADIRVDLQLFAADPVENKEKEPPMLERLNEVMKDMTEEELEDLEKYVEFILSKKKG